MRGHDSGHDNESMWAVLCLLVSSTTQISHLIGYNVVYLKDKCRFTCIILTLITLNIILNEAVAVMTL